MWNEYLVKAKQLYEQQKIDLKKYIDAETSILYELSNRVKNEISYNEDSFDLESITNDKKANCLGYTLIIIIIGNKLGFSISALNVLKKSYDEHQPSELHIVNLVNLINGNSMLIDLTKKKQFIISNQFLWNDQYEESGYHWIVKNNNQFNFYKKVQILNKNGLISQLFNNRGVMKINRGKYIEAIPILKEAIRLNLFCSEAYHNLAEAYSKLKDDSLAIVNYSTAIKINPEYSNAFYGRGKIFKILGRFVEAISDLSNAIIFNPKDYESFASLGDVYAQTDYDSLAILNYSKAIQLNPKYFEVYHNRGSTRARKGYYEDAINDYSEAIKINPNFADSYRCRGLIYKLLGKKDLAKNDLLHFVKLNPKFKVEIEKIINDFN
jgi:tetratricopeptide (TPR) repeat protein